jgi:hypothetical protein
VKKNVSLQCGVQAWARQIAASTGKRRRGESAISNLALSSVIMTSVPSRASQPLASDGHANRVLWAAAVSLGFRLDKTPHRSEDEPFEGGLHSPGYISE